MKTHSANQITNRKPNGNKIKRNNEAKSYITENYVQNQKEGKRRAPGNRSYADAIRYGKKILVIGDIHVRIIKRNVFNRVP